MRYIAQAHPVYGISIKHLAAIFRYTERMQMHELMRVTGHKDTRMLARYYHPRAEDLAKKLG